MILLYILIGIELYHIACRVNRVSCSKDSGHINSLVPVGSKEYLNLLQDLQFVPLPSNPSFLTRLWCNSRSILKELSKVKSNRP